MTLNDSRETDGPQAGPDAMSNLPSDDDSEWFERRFVSAAEAPPLAVSPGARSVFEVDPDALRRLTTTARRGPTPGVQTAPPAAVPRIVRLESGLIRCERVAYADTAEWHAAERARRAKQKPPKGKKIGWKKTRSKKLLTVISTVQDH